MVYLQPRQGNTKRKACEKERYLILLFKYINYLCFSLSPRIQDHFTKSDICSSIYMLLGELCIPVCFPDIASWMSAHHFKFSLENIHVFCHFGKYCPLRDPSITADKTMVTATQNAKDLVELWARVTAAVWHYQYNIRPFSTRECVQLLTQV